MIRIIELNLNWNRTSESLSENLVYLSPKNMWQEHILELPKKKKNDAWKGHILEVHCTNKNSKKKLHQVMESSNAHQYFCFLTGSERNLEKTYTTPALFAGIMGTNLIVSSQTPNFEMHYFITWWIFLTESWCNGLLICVPFTDQKLFSGTGTL